MRPLRVLMLSDVYYPRVNGVSTSIQTFRRDLDRQGCQSILIAPQYPEVRDDEPGIVRVRSRHLPLDPEDRVLVARELERAVLALHCEFDLIHVHTPFVAHYAGLRLARRCCVPRLPPSEDSELFHRCFKTLRSAARTLARVRNQPWRRQ